MKKRFTQFCTSFNRGFAMLFTVLIVSLILTIAIGISNITFKQLLLSNLANDSQIAFYEADSAAECALYYDAHLNLFPSGTVPGAQSMVCGGKTYILDDLVSSTNDLIFIDSGSLPNRPCGAIELDKTASSLSPYPGVTGIIHGYGYNRCAQSTRQVERAIEIRY